MRAPFYPSPYRFTSRQRLELSLSACSISFLLKALCGTCRTEYRSRALFDSIQRIHGRVLIAAWHESLGLILWSHRATGYRTLTSYSYDGELAARITWRFGMSALRGSSSRGGARALVTMGRALRDGHTLGITVDGPRGPRREAKKGIAVLAARSGLPILPVVALAQPSWRLNSWDRLMVPKPFGRIVCAYGDPVSPPPDLSADSIEQTRKAVGDALNRLHADVEAELGIRPV